MIILGKKNDDEKTLLLKIIWLYPIFPDFAIQKSNTAVNEEDDAAFVILPPQFSLNQNYSHEKEFKERSTDSATAVARGAASSTVSIHLQQSSMSMSGRGQQPQPREPDYDGEEEVELGKESDDHGHVVFAVISYLRLHQIIVPTSPKQPLQPQPHDSRTPSSTNTVIDPVISVRAEPRPKSPVQIRLGLPAKAATRQCYSIFDQRQCNMAKWHNGTRECVCNGLSRYAFSSSLLQMGHSPASASSAASGEAEAKAADVLMDLKEVLDQPYSLEEAMTTTMVVIVAVSSTLLVASLLSAALLVIYCRRVKVLETTSILLQF